MSQDYHFRVNAGIKNIIGKELIYSDNVAIIELIKNSKDAGASNARIKFIDEWVLTDHSTIMIIDNGKGMTLDDVEKKWLNIAYSEKKESEELLAGNKGVGRFSCDRLGEVLNFYTKHADGDYLHVMINWTDFEDKKIDDEISSIPVKINILTEQEFAKEVNNSIPRTGTALKISRLRDTWQTNKMKKLVTELEKFSPTLNEGFYVELYSENSELQDKVNKRIDNRVLDKIDFKSTNIKSFIDAKGENISTCLYSQGELIYEYTVENPYSLLKGIEVEIHYLDSIIRRYFTQKIGVMPVHYGSIFLFYNNFRISPYGNRGDDWLGLDQRKTQGTSRNLGTREVIGKITIIDKEHSFEVLSNREGLARTPAFHQLIAYDQEEKVSLNSDDETLTESYGYVINIVRQLESFAQEGLGWNRFIDTYDTESKKVITADDILRNPKRYQLRELSHSNIENTCRKLLKSNWNIQENKFKINQQALKKITNLAQEKVNDFLQDFISQSGDKTLKQLSEIERKKVKKIIAEEQAKTRKAEHDRNTAEKNHALAEKKVHKTQEELIKKDKTIQQVTSQNMFLKVTSNQDLENLLFSMHSILNYSSTLKGCINNIFDSNDKDLPKHIRDNLLTIVELNQKTFSIAKFATLYNFNDKTKNIYGELTLFIHSYIKELNGWQMHSRIDFVDSLNLEKTTNIQFIPLEMMILIDNIIANAKKAKATQIIFSNAIIKDNKIAYFFKDNGYGITEERFLDNINLIFDKGETSTNGSGIGLFHINKIVKKLNGALEVVNYQEGFELGVYLPCN